MTIIHDFDNDGAFVAADTETRRTVYAYPTSQHAVSARKHAPAIAREMMTQENSYGSWRDYVQFRERDEERIASLSKRETPSR